MIGKDLLLQSHRTAPSSMGSTSSLNQGSKPENIALAAAARVANVARRRAGRPSCYEQVAL